MAVPNQQWRLEPAGGGAVRIIARHSGQVLDVFGALLDDVTPIIQWPVHGGDNQVWTLEPASEGYVRIVARHSGKAMDVELASADDGRARDPVHAARWRESAMAPPSGGVRRSSRDDVELALDRSPQFFREGTVMTISLLTQRFVRVVIAFVSAACVVTDVSAQQPGATFEVVSIFDVADGRPNGVIQARNGQFYGTTSQPSGSATGTVFAMDAAGARTTLHRFERSSIEPIVNDIPMSNLFEGADGSLYGTTFTTPSSVFLTKPGQIFRISPTDEFTTISSAYWLRAGVIQARDGRLYGTSSGGLVSGIGIPFFGYVFRVEADATLTVFHRFELPDLASPVAELVEIDDGSLYGTTQRGLAYSSGHPPTPVNNTRNDLPSRPGQRGVHHALQLQRA